MANVDDNGEMVHDETPLGGHGGMNVVGVASPTKLNMTSYLRRPLSDCTNIVSNGESYGQVSEELAAKAQKETEKKRPYRGRVKADLENSVRDEELSEKRKMWLKGNISIVPGKRLSWKILFLRLPGAHHWIHSTGTPWQSRTTFVRRSINASSQVLGLSFCPGEAFDCLLKPFWVI
ncbi:hypothetical protein EJB05_28039, partial [Eragrostis curvula]